MFGFVLAQLRGRLRRTVALLVAVVAATSGFVVLSGAAETSQLRTTGTVEANYRSAYDVLVRPKGARSELEQQRNLVRPNYLSGMYGGITTAQLDQVRAVRSVEIAAPIAMLGFTYATVEQSVDLTDQVDPSAQQQVFRLTPTWLADRGLTVIDDAPQYVYLSRNALYNAKIIVGLQPPGPVYANGTALRRDPFFNCSSSVLEVSAAGRQTPLCAWTLDPDANGTTKRERTGLMIWQRSTDGRYSDVLAVPRTTIKRLVVKVSWKVMIQAAAIDPPAEAKLVGLDQAMIGGRYLSAGDQPVVAGVNHSEDGYDDRYLSVPTMMADKSYVDEQVQIVIERLAPGAQAALVGHEYVDALPLLGRTPGTPVGAPIRSSSVPDLSRTQASLGVLYRPGPPSYQLGSTGRLIPQPAAISPDVWRGSTDSGYFDQPPAFVFDTGFRPLGPTTSGDLSGTSLPVGEMVGRFDPGRLRGFSPLSTVPLETYQAPGLDGADDRSRQLLGGRSLLPTSSPTGYLSTPPLILTNLAALDRLPLADSSAPLSAIRVRVSGVTGMDAISQERVRGVAADIAAATGLDVDITIGSSPSLQAVTLPAGKYGRPELSLVEKWSRKGVAVTIMAAADRKSLLLSVLILAECAVFLGNAVAASARSRRRELAVLTCLGWPPGRLAVGLLGEVALVGAAGGLLAASISTPLAQLAGLAVPWWRAALAVPIGLGLALVAAALPTLSAIRATPAEAVVPAVRSVRRSRHHRTVFGTALGNLARVPTRALLGVLALTVGVAAVTLLAAVLVVYRNQVVGSMLGDAVTLQVRPVDLIATGATVLLGVVAVADVLYLNVRERAGEIAALWAAGWTDNALLRLVVYEGLGIGALGAISGAALGMAGIGFFVGGITAGLVVVALLTAVGATLLAGLCAVVPALLLRRLPLAALLAEE
ncbi:ABC transporter permease [Streptomyces sp. SID13031]|uniref:ABC transporter permease n=1 Tax=Streptomyces sp. SID13031 TaxID=2706046 RepID=UPI0013C94BC3|nr:ABC transporter permease [Streptomyces sp. SID13031]NEA32048.1 ABC transporter permease [Streptomyces sp. SID13031]